VKTSLHVDVVPLLDVVVVVQGPVGPVEVESTLVEVPLGLDVIMVIVIVPPQTSVVVVTVVVPGCLGLGPLERGKYWRMCFPSSSSHRNPIQTIPEDLTKMYPNDLRRH